MLKWLPVAYSAVLLMLLMLPSGFFEAASKQVPETVSGIAFDHAVHMALFFGFVMSWLVINMPPKRVVALSIAVAMLTEILQGMVDRFPSVDDFFANLIGIMLAWGLWFAWGKLTEKSVRIDVSKR